MARAAKTTHGSRTNKRREEEVFDVAIEVFNERGYSDASVEDIAQALGILKGSLYYYINSKEDLLFRILDDVHSDVQAILDEAVAGTSLAPLDRIAWYVRRQVKYNATHVARVAVYYREFQRLSIDRRRALQRRRRRQNAFVLGLIEQAQSRGEIDADIDPTLATNSVFGNIIWVYTWFNPGGGITPDELADHTAAFVLQGLTAAPALPLRELSAG